MSGTDQPTVEQAELALVVHRVLADLSVREVDVPLTVAALILGRPLITRALADAADVPALRRTVDQLRMRHAPVPVAPGEQRLVCAADRKGWPCPDGAILYEVEG